MQKILIVGAGPTGLTAGVELQRRGHQVLIVDRRENASGFSRAVGIIQTSLDYLRPSGVADALIEEGIHIRSARIFEGPKHLADIMISREKDQFLLALAQDRTEHHLAEAFKQMGGILQYGVTCEHFTQNDHKVTAHFEGHPAQEFDYLLGADGTRSQVRHQLDIPYEGFDLPEDWSIADAHVTDWPHIDHFCIFWPDHAGGIVVAAPLEQNRVRFIANRPDALEALPVPVTVSSINRSGKFKISIRQVPQYGKGRVFLAGDAAHCHSPAGGRGMNLGMEDAVQFASLLDMGGLESYSSARHVAGQKIIALSERARTNLTAGYPRRHLVKFGIRSLAALPALSTAIGVRFVLR